MPNINNFAGQKSILRQLVLAANQQANWGTPVAQAAYVEAIRMDANNFLKVTRSKESSYGQAGALNSFANQNWTTKQATQLEISGFLTDWIAGWLLANTMGKEIVSAGPPFTHTFNFLDSGIYSPVTSLYAKDTNDLAYQLVDMGISQLTITSMATGAMKYKATMMGTGRLVEGALGGMPIPVTRQNLYGSDLVVAIGPAAGAATSLYPRVRSFELTIDTGMSAEYASGGGLYAAFMAVIMPKVKLKVVILANGTDDIFGWKLNDTLLQLTATGNSGGSNITFTIPNFTIDENCQLSDANGMEAWTLDLSETDILQIGATPLITVAVTNSVASYLTAA